MYNEWMITFLPDITCFLVKLWYFYTTYYINRLLFFCCIRQYLKPGLIKTSAIKITLSGLEIICLKNYMLKNKNNKLEQQAWAKQMRELQLDIEEAIKAQVGSLPEPQDIRYTEQYRELLEQAELECPAPDPQRKPGQRGRVKRSKARCYWNDY